MMRSVLAVRIRVTIRTSEDQDMNKAKNIRVQVE